jgi:hypothetical protein
LLQAAVCSEYLFTCQFPLFLVLLRWTSRASHYLARQGHSTLRRTRILCTSVRYLARVSRCTSRHFKSLRQEDTVSEKPSHP